MKYKDLRDFIALLESKGELKRIHQEIDPYLEMTEICDRTLKAGGPALLFENPKGHTNEFLVVHNLQQDQWTRRQDQYLGTLTSIASLFSA